jgi:hypothetical protein
VWLGVGGITIEKPFELGYEKATPNYEDLTMQSPGISANLVGGHERGGPWGK